MFDMQVVMCYNVCGFVGGQSGDAVRGSSSGGRAPAFQAGCAGSSPASRSYRATSLQVAQYLGEV